MAPSQSVKQSSGDGPNSTFIQIVSNERNPTLPCRKGHVRARRGYCRSQKIHVAETGVLQQQIRFSVQTGCVTPLSITRTAFAACRKTLQNNTRRQPVIPTATGPVSENSIPSKLVSLHLS